MIMRTKLLFAAAAISVAITTPPARAQGIPGQAMVPLGYCQLSSTQLTSAVGLSSCSGGIPAGATMVEMQAESANVRYRDDGTAPTSSAGSLIVSGLNPFLYTGTLSALKFIAASGSPTADFAFYRQ